MIARYPKKDSMSDNWSREGMKRPCMDDIWSMFASRVGESRLQKRHCVEGTFSEISYSASGTTSMESDSTSPSDEKIRFFPCSSLSFWRWTIPWLLACVSYCSSDNAGSLATRRLRLYILLLLAPHYNNSRLFLLPRLSHMRTLELAGFESNRASIARKYAPFRRHSDVAFFFLVERFKSSGNLNVDNLMCKM